MRELTKKGISETQKTGNTGKKLKVADLQRRLNITGGNFQGGIRE